MLKLHSKMKKLKNRKKDKLNSISNRQKSTKKIKLKKKKNNHHPRSSMYNRKL